MSRVQLALNVDDIDEAVAFHTKLLGTGPVKRRDGYANFAIAEPPLKLVLLENPGRGGTLNHLGVEVPGTATVESEQTGLAAAGLTSAGADDSICCYAQQDKFWVEGAPDGESWEIYTVLADSPTFYGDQDAPACCRDQDARPAAAGPRNRARPGHRRVRPGHRRASFSHPRRGRPGHRRRASPATGHP